MKPKGAKRLDVITTKGAQFASVPNTPAGREWLHLTRGYLNRQGWRIVAVRGRAKDRRKKGGTREDIPARRADWLAVYIDPTKRPEPCRDPLAFNAGYHQAQADIRESESAREAEHFERGYHKALKDAFAALGEKLEGLRAGVDDLEDVHAAINASIKSREQKDGRAL